jgi:uncharacterized protein (TIGR03382 family)
MVKPGCNAGGDGGVAAPAAVLAAAVLALPLRVKTTIRRLAPRVD